MGLEVGQARPGPSNLQVHRPDTTLFATLHGLQMQSGVTVPTLRRLVLKELTDNALDAGDDVGRPGAAIEKLDRHRYRIEDQGDGIRGTPEQLAALFALDRPMISGKFWRRPERGALGNGLPPPGQGSARPPDRPPPSAAYLAASAGATITDGAG